MRKRVTLLLIIAVLTASSLLMVEVAPASATVAKPSVPEFTLDFNSNWTLVLRIKNQPLASYYDDGDRFYYSIRFKMDSDEVRRYWTILYFAESGYNIEYKTPSDSEYTVIPVGYYEGDPYGMDCLTVSTNEEQTIYLSYPDKVDFQVEALIGHIESDPTAPIDNLKFVGETSGWSETVTISVP